MKKCASVMALLLAGSAVASQPQWNYSSNKYEPLKPVEIKLSSGLTASISPSGSSSLQGSASPTVLSVVAGASYNFDVGFSLQSGDYLVRETNLKNWLKFSKSDYESQFTAENSSVLLALSYNTVTNTSPVYSASGSGSSTSWVNGTSSTQISCNFGGQSASDSGSGPKSVSINPGNGAFVSCAANPMTFGANAFGTLFTWASVNTGIYYAENSCNFTIFNAERFNCMTQCTASGSGSTSGSCSATAAAYVAWSGRSWGFSQTRHINLAGSAFLNKKQINLSGITRAFVSTTDNIFYIQRGTTLSLLDPNVGDEVVMTQLTAGDTPVRILTGLAFTPKPVTPPPRKSRPAARFGIGLGGEQVC